jgi:hypothetical protein
MNNASERKHGETLTGRTKLGPSIHLLKLAACMSCTYYAVLHCGLIDS